MQRRCLKNAFVEDLINPEAKHILRIENMQAIKFIYECDGEEIEIHSDSLKIKPIINVTDEDGLTLTNCFDNNDEFVWLSNPDDPKVARGWTNKAKAESNRRGETL